MRDEDGNGRIDRETEIWHEKHFYPYGQPMEGNYSNNTNTGWYNRNADVLKECYDGHNNMDYVAAMELDMYFTMFRSMDPGTGRWMQVDPKAVADPAMSVYAAMGNNPVNQVDPDGDFWQIAVGAAIGGAMYSIQAGNNWSWGGFGKAVGFGALGGAVSFGIGSAVQSAVASGAISAGEGMLAGAAAHGFSQGAISALQGGSFLQGASTGAVSSLIGGITASTDNVALTIAGGGVAGGVTSIMTGGSFWDGMKTGLIVSGLNHGAHLTQKMTDLHKFAKKHFGSDYKIKYGVKGMYWMRQVLFAKGANYNFATGGIRGKASWSSIGVMLSESGRGNIYFGDNLEGFGLFMVMGHEFIHAYHAKMGLFESGATEAAAYGWNIESYYANYGGKIYFSGDQSYIDRCQNMIKYYGNHMPYNLPPEFPLIYKR